MSEELTPYRDYAEYIERLRARQRQKLGERNQGKTDRARALHPIERFVESLAEAGEISRFHMLDDGCCCAVRVCSEMKTVLASDGSIQIACAHAYGARIPGQLFWRIVVESVGKKPRLFTGTDDYREVLTYLIRCITDQKVALIDE